MQINRRRWDVGSSDKEEYVKIKKHGGRSFGIKSTLNLLFNFSKRFSFIQTATTDTIMYIT